MVAIACPDSDELIALSSGNLSRERMEHVAAHVEGCSQCLKRLETLELDDSLLFDLGRPGASPYLKETAFQRVLERVEAIGQQCKQAGDDPENPVEETLTMLPAHEPAPRRLGVYEVLEQLGRGGMGTVYKGRHTLLKRVVALKVLPQDRLDDPHSVARFRREMEAVGKLGHPNIVQASDAGETDGVHFLVMEYVAGVDLSRLVKRRGPLPIADACEIIRQAALGLEHAHQHGLVHRDIKPSNLMVTPEGRVKLLDLGLALLRGERPGDEELTTSGQMMGTVDYMAPEQASDTHEVDIRADLYSLGCTLYCLLTGHAPFHGPEYKHAWAKLMAHSQTPAPPIPGLRPDVPEGLQMVLNRLLDKDLAARYATPAELEAAIAPFAAGSRLSALLAEPTAPRETSDKAQSETESLCASTFPSGAAIEPASVERPGPTALAPILPPRLSDLDTRPRPKGLPKRGRVVIPIAVALLGLGGLIVAWQIVIRIRDKEGRETTIKVPEGGTVTIEEGGKNAPNVKEPTVEPFPPTISPEPLALKPGDPISPVALVQRPAVIKGLLGWTIETRRQRGEVGSVKYDPKGRWLAIASQDGSIRLHDPKTGRLVRVLIGHESNVTDAAWHPAGSILASCGWDRSVRLWDAESGRLLRTLRGHERHIFTVAWSPDGKTLASGGEDGVLLWKLASEQAFGKLPVDGLVNYKAMAWSPDSKTLAVGVGSSGSRLWLWEVASDSLRQFLDAKDDVSSVTWSPDGKKLFSGHRTSNLIDIWDATSGKRLTIFEGTGDARSFAWSPDGKILTVGERSGVQLREAESDRLLHKLSNLGVTSTTSLSWSPDGTTLAGAERQSGRVGVWDAQTGQRIRSFEAIGDFTSAGNQEAPFPVWSPDGALMARWTPSGAGLWEAATGRFLPTLQGGVKGRLFYAIAWSPDGRRLAAAEEGRLLIFDVKASRRLFESPWKSGNNERSWACAWSPDGKVVAIGSPNPKLLEADSGALLLTLEKHTDETRSMAWSPDGKTIATGDSTMIRLFDTASGKLLHSLEGHKNPVRALAWSPDGKTLVSGDGTLNLYDAPGSLRFWDAESGKPLRTRTDVHSGPVTHLLWLPDGRTVISAGADRVVHFWDAGSGLITRSLPHSGISIAPDGRMIADSGAAMVRLVEAEHGEPRGVLVALADPLSLVLSPDGHYRGSPKIEDEIVYVIQTENGQETLTPEEFAARYGWKNDPDRVKLRPE